MISVENVCSQVEHERAKNDVFFWRSLALRGFAERPVPNEPPAVYEVRNCGCGSTLYKRVR